MPSTKRARLTAPTRLTETDTGDRFQALIYHVEDSDLFVVVDYCVKPGAQDWIVVERQGDDIVIAHYEKQKYLGVVKVLEYYELKHSEQWIPRIHALALHFIGLASSLMIPILL